MKIKIFSMLLALLLCLSACGGNHGAATVPSTQPATEPTTQPATQPPTQPQPAFPDITVENPVIYFSMTLADSFDSICSLTAWDEGNGKVRVEYVGSIKKVGYFDTSVLHAIAAEIDKAGLPALNGQSVQEEGEKFCSMFIQYAQESILAADFSGSIPQAFVDGYNTMADFFEKLTTELPEYVPQPTVGDGVNPDALNEMMTILNGSGIANLDSFTISDVPVDEYFCLITGLSSAEGIANCITCDPMMTTTPYSLVIVTVEDAAKAEAVRKDFAYNINWAKWICVSASDAMIAQKGNMVVCLLGSDSLYNACAAAIRGAGWDSIETLRNPNA